jgi:hypothetical protein
LLIFISLGLLWPSSLFAYKFNKNEYNVARARRSLTAKKEIG